MPLQPKENMTIRSSVILKKNIHQIKQTYDDFLSVNILTFKSSVSPAESNLDLHSPH